MDPREDKLPAWAKAELAKARSEAREAQCKLAAHLDTIPKSRLWYGDYGNPVYLPDNHTRVYWDFGDGSTFDQISIYRDEDILKIYGGSGISVYPSSSNSVRIKLNDLR